jgi:chemotaxis protein MotB
MAGGGGAWKVAYADFVTAMMAFFMVMWLVGQNDKLKEAVAEHFQHDPMADIFGNESIDPNMQSGGPRFGNGRFGKKKGDAARIPSPSESPQDPIDEKPRILTIHDAQRTTIGAMVPFAEHSSDLTTEGENRLNDLIPLIDGKPHKIEVRGHCSAAPNESGDNDAPDQFWKLAFSRALAVEQYLQKHGIASERIRLSVAGQYEPFTLEENRDQQLRNERVEVYLLNEFAKDLQGTKNEREKRYRDATVPDDTAPAKVETTAAGH